MPYLPELVYNASYLVMAIGLVLVTVYNHANQEGRVNQDEYNAANRRVEGGTIYREKVWELKRIEEESLKRLTALMLYATSEDARRILAEEIQARYAQLERLNELLQYRERDT